MSSKFLRKDPNVISNNELFQISGKAQILRKLVMPSVGPRVRTNNQVNSHNRLFMKSLRNSTMTVFKNSEIL